MQVICMLGGIGEAVSAGNIFALDISGSLWMGAWFVARFQE